MSNGARIEANRNSRLRDGEMVCEELLLVFIGLVERRFNFQQGNTRGTSSAIVGFDITESLSTIAQ